ncbi:MAG: cupin [Clostridiales bacterium]|nr:cupin [Clostridiales bacterium]
MEILQYNYEGNGLTRVFENPKWMVGIKNWKPENDINSINCLERHNETDELFILLAGRCTLLYANEEEGKLEIDKVEMQPMKVYNIPATLWHNTVTQRDTKLVLIEDSGTGAHNSDVKMLTQTQLEQIKAILA